MIPSANRALSSGRSNGNIGHIVRGVFKQRLVEGSGVKVNPLRSHSLQARPLCLNNFDLRFYTVSVCLYPSAPSPKSLGFRPAVAGSVGCFSRRAAPYLDHNGRVRQSPDGKTANWPRPEGCVENGSAASLLVSHVSIEICSFLSPRRRPILNTTKPKGFRRRCTSESHLQTSRNLSYAGCRNC